MKISSNNKTPVACSRIILVFRPAILVILVSLLHFPKCIAQVYYNVPDVITSFIKPGGVSEYNSGSFTSVVSGNSSVAIAGLATDGNGNMYFGTITPNTDLQSIMSATQLSLTISGLTPEQGLTPTNIATLQFSYDGISTFPLSMAVNQQTLFYTTPRGLDLGFGPPLPTISRLNLKTLASEVVLSNLVSPTGLCLGADGTLYFCDLNGSYPPQITIYSFGTNGLQTLATPTPSNVDWDVIWTPSMAIAANGAIFFTVPTYYLANTNQPIFVSNGAIMRLDPGQQNPVLVANAVDPMGLASDNAGNLYYGDCPEDPSFEKTYLFKLAPDKAQTNFGLLFDNSQGDTSFPFYNFSIAVLEPDLSVSALEFDPQHGGLGFSYTNQGVSLPTQTKAALYWATGSTTNDIITNVPPIFSTNIPSGFTGQATNYVPESLLNYPPTNATRLLLVLDLDNLITESTKTNNVTVLTNTFRHVVVVMMENRSFDHLLGWLPGANGAQAGLKYTNASAQGFDTWPLYTNFQGCGCELPDQTFGAKLQLNGTNCDGWLVANQDTFPIGYYVQTNLPFFGQIAPNWTVCDHYFAALMAETQPNRIYQHSAQTDSLTNRTAAQLAEMFFNIGSLTLPTIWDRLASKNIRRQYYSELDPNLDSVLNLWGDKYVSIFSGIDKFYRDCASGNLPMVSFVDPRFTSVLESLPVVGQPDSGDDDHPHSDIRNGEAFLANIYSNIVSSPNWSSTVLVINFDEWGGFFDHVLPPKVQVGVQELALGNDGRLGFRVPCVVISPWSRNGSSQKGPVNHDQFDHCSVLKMIENRWGLTNLTVRDFNANDLAGVLDLDHPDFSQPPQVKVPLGPFGHPCQMVQETKQPDGSVLITWGPTPCKTLQLQLGTTPYGPWTDVVNAESPFLFTPISILPAFFRVVSK